MLHQVPQELLRSISIGFIVQFTLVLIINKLPRCMQSFIYILARLKSVQMVGITGYPYAYMSKNGRFHQDSKTNKIGQKNIFFWSFSKNSPRECCQEAHAKFHRASLIKKCLKSAKKKYYEEAKEAEDSRAILPRKFDNAVRGIDK